MAFDLRRRRRPIHIARGDAFALAEFDAQVFRRSGICSLQHDMDIANASGATVRGDLNNALQSLASNSSGTSAPATTYAYQLWADTTNALLKQRNAANTGWLVRGTLAETFVIARSSNTIIGVGDFGRTFNCTSTFTQTLTAAATLGDGFVFAIRNNGTGVITIDPNSSETIDGGTTLELQPGQSCSIFCNGSAFITIGLGVRKRAEVTPGGRLSLTTAVPVTTSDVTGATTVYYTPHKHDTVELYDGTNWIKYQFTEMSQATSDSTKSPAAVTTSSNYDVFVWNDSGTLRATRGPAWSSGTSRGTGAGTTELELFEGRYVNKVAITNGPAARKGLYVGSIRSDGSSQINDSLTLRHVWNAYNRTRRPMRATEATDTWNYTTATWRQANANTANQLDFLLGLNEDDVEANVVAAASNTGAAGAVGLRVGIGLDVTNAIATGCLVPNVANPGSSVAAGLFSSWRGFAGIGRHFLAWLEISTASGTSTWYGDNGAPTITQSGIQGSVWG